MSFLLTPLIGLDLFILFALVSLATVIICRHFYDKWCISRKRFRVVEIPRGSESFKKALQFADPPFALEMAVHQLGRDIHTYIAIPDTKADKFIEKFGGKEVPDYNIYHPGGVTVGRSLAVKGDTRMSVDVFACILNDLDFSNVNEVGEGVVMQFIFGERRKGGFKSNVRVMGSAPTPYQAEEILAGLQKELSGCKWADEKASDFASEVTYRKFNPAEAVNWTI